MIQYTQLVDKAIYDGQINVDEFHGNERLELINALLDQRGCNPDDANNIVIQCEKIFPEGK